MKYHLEITHKKGGRYTMKQLRIIHKLLFLMLPLIVSCATNEPKDLENSLIFTNPEQTTLLDDIGICVNESSAINHARNITVKTLGSVAIGAVAGMALATLNPAFAVVVPELGRSLTGEIDDIGVEWYHVAILMGVDAAKDGLLEINSNQKAFIRECLQVKGYPVVWLN